MFPDNVPVAVYDNLIASVHRQLPALHHYYDVRRRKMGLKDIHFYDTYVPILSQQRTRRTWDEAVETIVAALAPLGSEYCETHRRRPARPLVRPLREPRQAERRLLARLLRRRPLHPHQLPARRARLDVHAGPRGRPLDAQLLLVQEPALRLLRLHALRGRGGQHLQRNAAEPVLARARPRTSRSGRSC